MIQNENILQWLQGWYQSKCDGKWEYTYGVQIGTLDNPGWEVIIDLESTKIETIIVDYQLFEVSENNWHGLKVGNKKFEAFGDPQKLEFLLEEFKKLADDKSPLNDISILQWIQDWYQSQCDGEWEHNEGLKIISSDNPGWIVEINVRDTDLEEVEIPYSLLEESEDNWYGIAIEDLLFRGVGDPTKLELLLWKFRELVEAQQRLEANRE